ncbi:MAG: hypothetical protein ABIK89_12090 [Planctomycetota bacterium]
MAERAIVEGAVCSTLFSKGLTTMVRDKTAPVARFPMRFLTLTVVLTGMVLAWLGWGAYRSYRVSKTVKERNFRIVQTRICAAVRLTVQGRDFTTDVAEIPDDYPVLIGQIVLEGLDFVVDPVGQRLIGNPEHGGEHMLDVF